MADLQKTVSIIFSGEDSNLSATVQSLSKGMDAFDKQVGKMSDPLANVGTKILELDAAIAALAIGAIALAVNKAAEFDESFAQISTRISASSEDINKFKDNVLNYGADSSKSLGDINDAISQNIQKGISYKDSLEMIALEEKFSIANRSDLKTATELLTTTMNAYGASSSEAGHYADVFTSAIQHGAGSIPQLADGLGKVAGLAAAAGIPIETITAAIAALGAQGIPAETAIMGITRLISNMLQPTAEVKKAASEMGVAFNAAALQTQGLEGVLKSVYASTGGNAEKMKELFGSVRGLVVAVDLATDAHGNFKKALDATRNSSDAMITAYDKQKEELGYVIQNLKNNIDVTLIDVGQKLLPGVGKLGSDLANIFKGIKIGIDQGALQPVIDFINKASKDMDTAMKHLAEGLPAAIGKIDLTGLMESLKDFGAAITESFTGKDINADNLAKSLQSVINTMTTLIDVTHGITEGLGLFAKGILTIIDGLNKLGPETTQQIGELLAVAMGFKMFGPTGGLVMMMLGADPEGSSEKIQFAFAAIENGINAIKVATLSVWLEEAKLWGMADKLLPFLGDTQKDVNGIEKLRTAFNKANDSLEKSSLRLDAMMNGTYDYGEAAKKAAKNVEDLTTDVELFDEKGNLIATVTVNDKDLKEFYKKNDLEDYLPPINVPVIVTADKKSLQDTADTIYSKFGGASVIRIKTELDGSSTIENVDKMNNLFTPAKKVEIKPDITQTAVADIKAKSDIVQKAVEWKAKIDIANIESGTKTMEVAFKSVDNSVTDTGKTLLGFSQIYESLLTKGSYSSVIENEMKAESSRRTDALQLQKDLAESQIKNMDARTNALSSGQALIQIDGKGLAPQLEAFMFKVLESIQVRANAEGAELLVGSSSLITGSVATPVITAPVTNTNAVPTGIKI